MMAAHLLLLALHGSANAQHSRAVMEGVRTSNNTILVSTRNVRLLVSTTVYNGGIPNVGLYTSSNVVVSDQSSNKCVIYATGSLACLGFNGALSGNATTATALAANGANCAAGLYPLGVNASGAAEGCSVLASSANALSGNPANCSAGNYPLGIDAYGAAESCTATVDLSANNVFTGQNRFSNDTTFTDSVYISAASTIGPQGYATAVTKSSGTLNNGWMVVASTFPTNVSASTFTGLASNRMYRLNYNLRNLDAAGVLQITFNGDVGDADYAISNQCLVSNASADNYVSAGAVLWQVNGSATGANGFLSGWIEFMTVSAGTSVNASGVGTYWSNTASPPIMAGCHSHVVYTGESTVTSVELKTSGGILSGVIYLEELIVPNP